MRLAEVSLHAHLASSYLRESGQRQKSKGKTQNRDQGATRDFDVFALCLFPFAFRSVRENPQSFLRSSALLYRTVMSPDPVCKSSMEPPPRTLPRISRRLLDALSCVIGASIEIRPELVRAYTSNPTC